ncbi:MAG TPA: hypothetical protein VOA41_12110 [Candidatus Dormibacteraeota bacterium]|nr:hypothetical protein [Candidatus Dormibacteraeota bacterium]
MLGQPPVVPPLIGPRLLDQSRLCLDRVYTLALVYRISGVAKYLERAATELRSKGDGARRNRGAAGSGCVVGHGHRRLGQTEIKSPKGAVLDTVPTNPPTPRENPNTGTHKLVDCNNHL